MDRVSFQVTTRTGVAGQKVDAVVQADGSDRPSRIASTKMAHVVGTLIENAAQAASNGLVCEVAVLVYPSDLDRAGMPANGSVSGE